MDILTTLKFIKNLSDYYIKNRNRYFIAEKGLPDNTIVYRNGKYFFAPDNLLIYKLWENHVTARYIRHEVGDFINLSQGKKVFLDIGASAGIFSCVFRSEVPEGKILSVEPDSVAFNYLQETMLLNKGMGYAWESAKIAMSDFDGEVPFDDGAFGGNIGQGNNKRLCRRLEMVCSEYKIEPDLIKIDIESYEYEVITSSMDILQKLNCNIQIEIHNDMIRSRGLNPDNVFKSLRDLGFRGVGKEGGLDSKQVRKPIVHLHLVK